MADDLSHLESLTTELDRLDVSHEALRVPSSIPGEDDRDALRVFVRRCPIARTPLRGVMAVVKDDCFWWGYRAFHPVDDPHGAALAIQTDITVQENRTFPIMGR
ncbi:hypothetical protein [Actinomadura sp. 9N215]|uniref:hypothetical protein n=1 Tax=Actinomadura sp. 9N215 TaxID=3375150 RepID=UPI0037B65BB5